MAVRGSARSVFYPVAGVLFLLLLYRLSMLLPQIKTLFALTFIAFPTLFGMFAGFKLLRVKEASTRSIVLFLVVLSLTVPLFLSQMLYLMRFPNPLESTYSSQPIIIIMFAVLGIVIVSASPVRDFLMRLVSSRGRFVRSVGSSYDSASSHRNAMFLGSRLSLGRFVILAGLSVLGIPRGFPSPGSKLTQDVEGILSSSEDLGSYSTGFLTSLSKLKEQIVFEIRISKKRVSLYFYVLSTSRSVKDAIERVSSAVQKVQGAITGAYGKNVKINTLSALDLASALNAILGEMPATYQIELLNRNDEEESYHSVNSRGRIARAVVVDDDQSYRGVGGRDARYLGVLRLSEGLPALKASGGENQMSMLISSLLGSDATEMNLIVNFKPHRPSLVKKLQTREAPTSLRDNRDRRTNPQQSFRDVLDEQKILKELSEAKYGESSGYWKVSVHIVVSAKSALGAIRSLEAAEASMTSIFSDPNFTVELEELKGSSLVRAVRNLPLRRLMYGRSLEMSSVRLSALVHMPTQPYPGIDRRELPEFEVPQPLEEADGGKLVLGKVLYGDRELYLTGIDLMDLALNMVVIGHIGSGKTMFVSQLILNLWDANPRIGWLIFDVKGEYTRIGKALPEVVTVYRPGDEGSPLRLNIFDRGVDNPETHALKLFAILRDTLSSLFEDSAELSPQMERLCRDALIDTVADPTRWSFKGFYECLEEQAQEMQPNTPTIMSSLEAIKNRVEKFRHGVLRNVFDVSSTNITFDAITTGKVIIDLSFLLSHGGTKDDVRLLMNVVLKNMFDRAMKLGLSETVRHITVVEEAGLLVPEVFSRRTSSETTVAEDIVLVERALGEGMILVSPRPTISENILANSGTKVIFRCPYDSQRVARFLNLNLKQESYLKVLPKREAIVTIPDYPYPFRIRTLDSQLPKMPPSPPEENTKNEYLVEAENHWGEKSLLPEPIYVKRDDNNKTPVDFDHQTSMVEPDDDFSSSLPFNSSARSAKPTVKVRANNSQNSEASNRRSELEGIVEPGSKGDEQIPSLHDTTRTEAIRVGDAEADRVDEKDVLLLLERTDSDRFRIFREIAENSRQRRQGDYRFVRTTALIEKIGSPWGFMDAYRSLTSPQLWRKPLIESTENGNLLKLTSYGEKVWNFMTTGEKPILSSLESWDRLVRKNTTRNNTLKKDRKSTRQESLKGSSVKSSGDG